MAQVFKLRTATLWVAAMLIAAVGSWTLFTGWGVTASYVGSHVGMGAAAEIQQARTKATAFFVGLLCAQILLFLCGGKLMAILRNDRPGILPSLKSLGLGIAAGALTDALVFGTLLVLQIQAGR